MTGGPAERKCHQDDLVVSQLTAAELVTVVLAVVLSVALEGPGDALVPGGALPLVVPAGRPGRVGSALGLVTPVPAVVISVTAPGLENTFLVVALILVRFTQTVVA